MKGRRSIAAQCSIVFCIFVACYHYQVQALDEDRAAACAGPSQNSEREIRLSIRSKNGSISTIISYAGNTVLHMQKEVEKIVGVPPGEQIFSHMGSTEYFDWPQDTLLGDIEELGRLTKDSHIFVIKREDWDTSSFDGLLQNFFESRGKNTTIIRFLKKNGITQFEEIRDFTEKNLIGAGLKLITARKFLQNYYEYLEEAQGWLRVKSTKPDPVPDVAGLRLSEPNN
jgi:hypothetical protein